MTSPDYSTWLTKQAAADAIGVSTKTIEQLAKDKQIEQAAWRPQNRGMPRAVYQPDDVARIAAERRGEAAPFVLPPGVPPPANGNGHRPVNALTIGTQALPSGEDVLRLVFALAQQRLTSGSSGGSSSSERVEKPFVTIREASGMTGLTQAYLRRQVEAGTLPAIRDRGWRIRRKDLEAL